MDQHPPRADLKEGRPGHGDAEAAERRLRLARLLAERRAGAADREQADREQADREQPDREQPDPVALLADAMRRHADLVAVDDGLRQLRYAELAGAAATLAADLRLCGAGPGASVGIMPGHSADLVTAVLAVLQTGAAILPLEPDDGADRLVAMVAADRPVAVIGDHRTGRALVDGLRPGPDTQVLPVPPHGKPGASKAADAAPDMPLSRAVCRLRPDADAITIDAATLGGRLAWLAGLRPLGPGDRVGFAGSLHGGALSLELLWPLCRGATVVPLPGGIATACDRALDVLHMPASEARDFRPSARRLRLLMVSGDRLDGSVVRRLYAEAADDVIALLLAPAVCGPAAFQCCARTAADGPLPMGQAAALRLTIRDHRGGELPAGVPGTLWFDDRLSLGQRARRRPGDGLLEWLEPSGDCGLLGGMPVSAASIAAALMAQPGIVDAHARIGRNTAGQVVAIGYAVPAGTAPDLPDGLSAGLARMLPPWSRPVATVAVSGIPLCGNGVDDAALAGVPVIDAGPCAALEGRLAAQPGVEAAVLTCPARFETGQLVMPPLPPLPAPAQPHRPRPAHAVVRPSHADGGALVLPDDAPRTLGAALERTAQETPGRGLTIRNGAGLRRLTYATLHREAQRIAAGLQSAGVGAGDAVVLQLPDHADWAVGFWAAVLTGALPVTVAAGPDFAPDSATAQKLLAAHTLLGAPLVLTTDALAGPLEQLGRASGRAFRLATLRDLGTRPADSPLRPHRARPGDVLFLQLSSGSTGVPKCIRITHAGVVAHIHGALAEGAILRDHAGEDQVGLNWLPMDHVVPVMTHLRDLYLGRDQVQIDTGLVLADPLVWLRAIQAHRATHIWSPNFGYKLVADALRRNAEARFDLSSVRRAMNAGEQVTLRTTEAFLAATRPFGLAAEAMQPAFGMAETCTCMTFQTGFSPENSVVWLDPAALQQGRVEPVGADDPAATALMRLGPPVPGVEIRIAGPDGAVLPEATIGRLQIRGDVVTPGYVQNEAANREALVGDGWLDSGDLGFMRDGALVLTGRAKETIIVNGANYYCHEIEDLAGTVDGVAPGLVAATGLPDTATGTEGLAITFVPAPGADPQVTAAAVRREVARRTGLRPSLVVPIDRAEFPKTTSGKIQRTRLRERLAGMAEQRSLPDWFMREAWLPRARPTATDRPGEVTILADAEGQFAATLADACARAGLGCRVVTEPDALTDTTAVIDARPLGWRSDPQSPASDAAAAAARVLMAVQRLPPSARLVVITRRAFALAGDPPPDAAVAVLRPLARSIASERPGLDVRHIDIGDGDPGRAAGAVLAELLVPHGAAEVALRGSQRLVPRLRPTVPVAEDARGIRLRLRGRYIVTGGSSPVGRTLVRHLLEECQAQVLITGRAAAAERAAVLQGLEGLGGEWRYATADAADPIAMEQAIDAATAAFGGPFDVAFHLAGSATACLTEAETEASLADAFAAKVDGAAVLDRLLRSRGTCGLVVLSSVNAVFGGAGAGAYGAANAAMAALALARQAAGHKTAVVHCSQWQGLGISARLGLTEFASARGFLAMPPDQAVASLLAAAAAGGAWLIGLDAGNPHLRPRMAVGCRPLRSVQAHVAAPTAGLAALRTQSIADIMGVSVPWTLVPHAALPKLASGAIDRAALAVGATRDSESDGAPASPTEQRLAMIWQDLLGRSAVRRSEDFFAAGGHSLTAARLMLRIREAFGVDLPLRIVFQSPTIAAMAAAIDAQLAGNRRALPACLVPLQETGDGNPFFCVHPAGGSPFCYASLAVAIGDGQPFLGFQAPGLADDSAVLASVEAMAENYAAAIREVQPDGPYRIGAWSSGGPVAFEIARRLHAGGAEVSLLAMIDCGLMESDNPLRGWGVFGPIRGLVEISRYLGQVRFPRRYAELRSLAQMIGLNLPVRLRDLRPSVLRDLGRCLRLFNINARAGLRYRPQTYDGRVTLFRAGGSAVRDGDPVVADLSRYAAQGVELVPIHGNHMSVVLDPAGNRELAAALAERLGSGMRAAADDIPKPRTAGDER